MGAFEVTAKARSLIENSLNPSAFCAHPDAHH